MRTTYGFIQSRDQLQKAQFLQQVEMSLSTSGPQCMLVKIKQ